MRRKAVAVTATVGAFGGVAAAIPFIASFQPSERARAAGAPVESDIAGMAPGNLRRVELARQSGLDRAADARSERWIAPTN